jgi:Ca2+-binding EF-hand superfamily protein
VVVDLDEMELFRTFKKYDRNMNGTLSFSEYSQCLAECPGLDLTKQEIVTASLAADVNCDGCIDFEEFMKHFSDILNLMNFNQQLQVELEKDMKRINDLKLAKENTSPTGAGGK